MRKFYSILLAIAFVIGSCISLQAQNNFFTDVSERNFNAAPGSRVIVPQSYRSVSMDVPAMKNFLMALPDGKNLANRSNAPIISLPRPDGTTATFRVWEASIQEPALQQRFPEIRTFSGQGIDDPYATIRFDITPRGFHAQVLTINGTYYIDPYAIGNDQNYISYFRTDLHKSVNWTCDVIDAPSTPGNPPSNFTAASCRGTEMRTYRLAVACTGEYAQAPGVAAGSDPALLHAAIVTTVNRVVGVYEKEVAVSMVLIANNNVIEYLNAATDPFNGNNNANVLINESQVVIDANIGPANYDIGHTFSTGGGGLAQLNSPCGSSKARGITGSPFPTGDAYDIDYVAHEMGHQYGGNHTMNGCGSSPNSTKYEPGSGTTIQAYAGICGAQNIQPNSDPHFHGISFDEISNFVMVGNGATCGVTSPTGNTLPVIDPLPNNNLSIPPSTPFTLTGSATDANGDALSYSWEQWDLGLPGQGWNVGLTAGAGNTAPLFKSRVPKATGSRTFPDIAVILAGYPANPAATMGGLKGEILSPVERPMKFRLTVRDNRAGGGGVVSSGGGGCQSSTALTVNVVGSTPFTVTVPNGGESYPGSSTQTVTWNVAGTNTAPVSVANVRILLSTDGGLTYPTVVLASTPNDGSESVTIPNIATTQARIKVEALDNIFFDISNANWTITAATSGFNFSATTPASVACGGPATASVTLGTTVTGGFSTPINLTAAGNPAGTTVTFGTNPLTPGNSTSVTLNNVNTLAPGSYNVTVTGVAGAITQNATVTFTVTPGTPPSITTQPAAQTLCAGGNASFSVVASGTVTYQWQVSTNGGTTYTNVAGATSPTLNLNSVTAGMNGNLYQVIVSATCGSATSSAALLTVNSGPAITAQPQNATACTGSNATFSVTATGGGLTYQWEVSTNGGTTWTPIGGATSSSYTANAVTTGMNGNQYHVIITGACPSPVTSNAATLTVGDAAAITTQPVASTVCVGANTSFTVVTTGTVTYQWQVSTDGGTTFNNVAGATSATLNLNAVTASMSGNIYQVLVFNCSSTSITSTAVALTVNTPISVTTQPVASTVCAGANASFAVTAAGTGVTYQWQVSTDGGTTFTNIAGATSATLNLAGVTASMSGNQYHVVMNGPCNPGGVTSSNVALTVNVPVTISAQPQNTEVCLPNPASFSVTAAGTGITYQWQVSTDGGASWSNIAGATSATLTLPAVTLAMNNNRYRVILNGACTSNLASNAATLIVNNPVAITAQPQDVAACSGDDATFTVEATGGIITYQWQVSMNGGAFVNIPGATSSSYTVSNVNTSMNGNEYQVIVSGVPCGVLTSSVATLSVNLAPGVVLAAAEYTSINPGVPTSLYTTVSPVGTYSYEWFHNGDLVPGATASSLPVTVDELGNYTVLVTDVNTGCSRMSNLVNVSDSASANVFVYPNPNNGQFQVRYFSASTAPTAHTVTVFDSKGARVFVKRYTVSRVYDRMDVNMQNASAGVYMLEISDASGKRLATTRLIVN